MSEILRLRSGETGQSVRSAKVAVRSSNGSETHPQDAVRGSRDPPWKPDVVKWLILVSAGIICVSIIARIGYYLLLEETPTTDKAVVKGNTYLVSSRIDGTISGILVSNRQYVKAGDLLAEIDRRDLRAKLAAAQTDLLQAQTMLPEIETQLSKAQAEFERAESRAVPREKELAEATSDFQYISKIRNKKNVSPLLFLRGKKEYESALKEYDKAKTNLVSAGDNFREAKALRDSNFSRMQKAEAIARQTETELRFTKVYAPANGHVVFDKTNLAHRLSAGEPFLKLVGDDPWIVANFNEYQAKRIKLNQKARIRIEAIKERTFEGKVVNVGSVKHGGADLPVTLLSLFALVEPPQTVPVKIEFDSESVIGFAERIDPDLNSFVEIDTGTRQD
jgi:membrane fusion protein, multidrug efflux system